VFAEISSKTYYISLRILIDYKKILFLYLKKRIGNKSEISLRALKNIFG